MPHDLVHVLLCSTGQVPASYEEVLVESDPGLEEGQGKGRGFEQEEDWMGAVFTDLSREKVRSKEGAQRCQERG